jgi:hypothetical protein
VVIRDFPLVLCGVVPDGLPYSAWQVLEHMRITQRSMLEYARDNLAGMLSAPHKEIQWPRDYWAKQVIPPSEEGWRHSVWSVIEDRRGFEALMDAATDDSLVRPSAPRNRKTLLRLALQIADHNSYHVGQLVIIRRLLRSWPKAHKGRPRAAI